MRSGNDGGASDNDKNTEHYNVMRIRRQSDR
jgi:hypothetical protein